MKIIAKVAIILSLLSLAACQPLNGNGHKPDTPGGLPQPGDRIFILQADIVNTNGNSALGKQVPPGYENEGTIFTMEIFLDMWSGSEKDKQRPAGAGLPIEDALYRLHFRHTVAIDPHFHGTIHVEFNSFRANTVLLDSSFAPLPKGYAVECSIQEQGKPGYVQADNKIVSVGGNRTFADCDTVIYA